MGIGHRHVDADHGAVVAHLPAHRFGAHPRRAGGGSLRPVAAGLALRRRAGRPLPPPQPGPADPVGQPAAGVGAGRADAHGHGEGLAHSDAGPRPGGGGHAGHDRAPDHADGPRGTGRPAERRGAQLGGVQHRPHGGPGGGRRAGGRLRRRNLLRHQRRQLPRGAGGPA